MSKDREIMKHKLKGKGLERSQERLAGTQGHHKTPGACWIGLCSSTHATRSTHYKVNSPKFNI
jgi:hypothetical protein